MDDITAVILAGGLGTRLRSVVKDRPKALVEIRGRPFLAYLLDQLSDTEINAVILCTGYLGDQIERMIGSSYRGMQIYYSKDSYPVGTGGALRRALPLLKSEVALVMNGDSFCEIDLNAFINWHVAQSANISIAIVKNPEDPVRYGRVEVHEDGRVAGFNPINSQPTSGWINAGIYLISRSIFAQMPEKDVLSLEEEVLPRWVGDRFYGYVCRGRFIDIGTPDSLAAAAPFLASMRRAP